MDEQLQYMGLLNDQSLIDAAPLLQAAVDGAGLLGQEQVGLRILLRGLSKKATLTALTDITKLHHVKKKERKCRCRHKLSHKIEFFFNYLLDR